MLRIPYWARVALAYRSAQRVLSLLMLPANSERAEEHYSAVEQAVDFAVECAEAGGIIELSPFENIQFSHLDPAMVSCVCAAVIPFGNSEFGLSMTAYAIDYANWAAWWHSGGSTLTESYQFASQTNMGIWSDFGRLWETAHNANWDFDTKIPRDFFEKDDPVKNPTVFICYAKRDELKAKELFRRLRATGLVDPWLDKYKLVLGDDWEAEIRKSVRSADAFVVCLRPEFDKIGFRQKEIRWAKDALELRPPGHGFIIPFIIEPCSLPDWCSEFHAGSDISKPTSFMELWAAVKKHCSIEE